MGAMLSKRLLYPLLTAWLLALVIATYVARLLPAMGGAETLAVLTAVGRVLIDIAAVTLTVLVGGGLGTLLLRRPDPLSPGEGAAVRALIGLALISVIVLAAGLLGMFPPRWLAWTMTLALTAALHRPALAWLRDLRAALRPLLAPEPDALLRWSRRVVIGMLALGVLLALAPPTMWDALMYHLAGGRYYLQQGAIVANPANYRLGNPQLVLMLYTWLQILARPHSAALLHWAFGGLAVLMLLSAWGRLSEGQPPTWGWVAAAVLLASPTLRAELSWPYSDLAAAAYGFGALLTLLAWDDATCQGLRLPVLAGLLTGCMMGVRYTAYATALGIGLFALWLARREGITAIVRAGAAVALAALLTFVPWLVKNAVTDGNPVSPYIWGAPGFDDLDEASILEFGGPATVVDLILLPVQATVFGSESAEPYQASITPLLAGMLPFAFVGWRRRSEGERRQIIRLAAFCGLAYAAWLAGIAASSLLILTRFMFPIFPALALLVTLGLAGLADEPGALPLRRITRAVTLIVVLVAAVGAVVTGARTGSLRVTLGLQDERDYLLHTLQAHYAAMEQINALPDGSRTLMLWEPREFYCLPGCTGDDVLNTWWRALQEGVSPQQVAASWRVQGYTHVLIFEAGARFVLSEGGPAPLSQADLDALDTLRGLALLPVWELPGVYTLYELAPDA
ncbi:MAG: hypothetical protein Kow00124_14250 [Anaerolineae bacterium]